MTRPRKVLAVCSLLALALPSSAYYHFVRYQNRVAPFGPIVERFDLAALPGSRVQWFLNESNAPVLASGDSMAALISQVQAAARVWDEVATSALRIGFGGSSPAQVSSASPWIEVTFDEVPPGLIAMAGPVTRGEVVNGPDGPFVPIVKSLLILNRDLTGRPSYTERFFLNVVHEFGHTLGLQHSWTSGAMSTEITRATTKGSPLSPDDEAGLSVLYPNSLFRQRTGSISGRVTLAGNGAHLASVVAIPANGPAVSALSLPDGTYKIEGLPPGNYHVYVHALPPPLPGEPTPVNLVLPSDPAGQVQPAPFFDLQFWPGNRLPQSTLAVSANQTIENVNFEVVARTGQTMHSVQSYSFYTNEPVKPAFLDRTSARGFGSVVLTGYGLVNPNGGPVNGLGVRVMGDRDPIQRVIPYPSDNRFLQVDVGLTGDSVEGHRHLIFSLGDQTHVVPSALRVVSSLPPGITSVTARGDRIAEVKGERLSAATRFWLDGVRAFVRQVDESGITLELPAASNLHIATLVAVNPDGQSSLFLLGASSPTLRLDRTEAGTLAITPNSLNAGTEGLVEISSLDGQFGAATLQLGFGTPDVSVKRVFVLSPNRVWAQVAVAPSAAPSTLNVQALNGLQFQRGPQFFVQPFNARSPFIPLGAQPPSLITGGAGVLRIENAPSTLSSVNSLLLIGDQAAPIASLREGVLTFTVPTGLPLGLTIARLTLNGEPLPPAVVRVDPPPPVIIAVQNSLGNSFNAANPATPGMLVQILVQKATIAGRTPIVTTTLIDGTVIEHPVMAVLDHPNPTLAAIFVSLGNGLNQTFIPLVVSVGGSSSAPVNIPFRP